MAVLLFVLGVVLSPFLWNVGGITLSPCGSDDTAEVIEGKTDNTFTCSGLPNGQKVNWIVEYNSQNNVAGVCGSVSSGEDCQTGDFGDAFTPSRVSNTESQMVVDPTQLSNKGYFQNGTLKCGDGNNADSCQMDYIVPAQGSCSVQAGTGSSRFQLDGKCTLQPGAKSARNRFGCEWNRNEGVTWQQSLQLTKNNYQAGCKLTDQPLPTTSGQYTYTVTLVPGRNTVTAAGTVHITKPATPTVSGCGGESYVPENTAVTCTCTTDTIGQPAGRLKWVKIGNSSATKVGNYGDRSFTVSQTLQRSDHQSTQFRCEVEWTVSVPGSSVKFNVGYPPTQISLRLNGDQNNLAVDEHQSVDFRCQDSDGRPEPTVSLVKKDNSSVLLSHTTFLSHEVVGRCEDSGQYVCTADNGMGSVVTSVPRSLSVRCSPRGEYDVGEVNFINVSVSTTFDVTAYPVPDKFTFHYLGPTKNDTNASDIDHDQIKLQCNCQPKPGVAYLSTCMVTVENVTAATAAGFYQVTVTNTPGNGQFRLHVLYKAPVTPAPDKAGEEGTDVGVVVGAVIGSVVVIALVVLVIVFVMRRRKDPAKEKLHTSAGASTSNGGHTKSHGELDNPALQLDPEQPESTSPPAEPHTSSNIEASAAGGDAYAVVVKPKRAAAAAEVAGEGTSGTGEYLYAEVDKKKKKGKAAAPTAAARGKKASPAKAKKDKGRKASKGEEANIYGNVDPKEGKGKKGKKSPAMPMEQKTDTGRQVTPEGLIYTAVDFTGVEVSSEPPRKPSETEQGVVYSAVDIIKTAELQK